jgi:hypothetical protein
MEEGFAEALEPNRKKEDRAWEISSHEFEQKSVFIFNASRWSLEFCNESDSVEVVEGQKKLGDYVR